MNIREVPLRKTISGLNHTLSVIEYTVDKPKANIYMQAALHAGELNGIAIIQALQTYLKENPLDFNFKLIPFANPFAMDVKVGEYTYGRFDAKTGDNWNRGFKNLLEPIADQPKINLERFICDNSSDSFDLLCGKFTTLLKKRLEILLSLELAPYERLAALLHYEAVDADFSFDLHNDSISVPYVYAPEYLNTTRLKHFNSDYFVLTPNEISTCFNQAIFYPWWQFTDAWNEIKNDDKLPPKHAFTYETGNKESFDVDSAKKLLSGILAYIKNDTVSLGASKYACHERDFFRIRAQNGGLIDYDDSKLGQVLVENERIARLYTKEHIISGNESIDIKVPCDNSALITRTASSSVHEGDEVAKVMRNIFSID
ncbi:succinylglutamate desuccinylase/aspartoacylase family protein [Fangia hongkongensis]|uniref:succinylglutamate desuccinylase/aspartoacylase family protein n=1 Tax=Fangia hongkongensis TaxID=270495 RepID=UPI0003814388|nr:succinylglutamate desuccinylase/aspartoacylase family protein [Fangia hongkongensis]MBK2125825.1 succinylglutamate desuccinylase/aspartoacylase family protein [Fangia hongkongensis]